MMRLARHPFTHECTYPLLLMAAFVFEYTRCSYIFLLVGGRGLNKGHHHGRYEPYVGILAVTTPPPLSSPTSN